MPRRLPTHKPNQGKRFLGDGKAERAKRLRSRAAWSRCSKIGKQLEPLCCAPFGQHGERPEPATDRHHIKPVQARPDLEGKKRAHRLTREHWAKPDQTKKPPEWEA